MFSFINMSMGMYFTAVTGLLNTRGCINLYATIALQAWTLTDEKGYFTGFQELCIFLMPFGSKFL